MTAYMISSVTARSTNRSDFRPAYREKSIGLPNRTPGPDRQPGQQPPGRLQLEGPDHGAGDHRCPRLQRQPGYPGLAAVQAAIRRPGAFRVDAEQLSVGQHAQAGPQCPLARLAARPVHRNLPDTAEEGLADQALHPAAGEVLGLGEERHLARQRQRAEEVIGERQVVPGEDGRSFARYVVRPLGPRPEQDREEGPEYRLDHPVTHADMLPRPDNHWQSLAGGTWPAGPLPVGKLPAPCPAPYLSTCALSWSRATMRRAQVREDGRHASDAGGGALLPLRRQHRGPALPRVHRKPGVAAALGRPARRRRADRLPPPAARPRHHLAGHGAYPLGGLVRGGGPGIRGTARARR